MKKCYIVLAKKIMPSTTRSFSRIDVYIYIYICLDRKKNDITIRACYTDSAFQSWYQRWQRVSRTSLSGHISSIVLDVVSIS